MRPAEAVRVMVARASVRSFTDGHDAAVLTALSTTRTPEDIAAEAINLVAAGQTEYRRGTAHHLAILLRGLRSHAGGAKERAIDFQSIVTAIKGGVVRMEIARLERATS